MFATRCCKNENNERKQASTSDFSQASSGYCENRRCACSVQGMDSSLPPAWSSHYCHLPGVGRNEALAFVFYWVNPTVIIRSTNHFISTHIPLSCKVYPHLPSPNQLSILIISGLAFFFLSFLKKMVVNYFTFLLCIYIVHTFELPRL